MWLNRTFRWFKFGLTCTCSLMYQVFLIVNSQSILISFVFALNSACINTFYQYHSKLWTPLRWSMLKISFRFWQCLNLLIIFFFQFYCNWASHAIPLKCLPDMYIVSSFNVFVHVPCFICSHWAGLL
jgi:hypothetical protein